MNRPGSPNRAAGYPSYSKVHSEMDAYTKTRHRIDSVFEIVNIRLSRLGELKNSKPCEVCTALLNRIGCTKVTYTTELGFEKI